MAKYRIFAGLGGGFGGATEHSIEEFDSLAEAEAYAYVLACEEYESYEGMYGLFNEEEYLDDDPDLTEEELAQLKNDDMESWIEYWAEEVEE